MSSPFQTDTWLNQWAQRHDQVKRLRWSWHMETILRGINTRSGLSSALTRTNRIKYWTPILPVDRSQFVRSYSTHHPTNLPIPAVTHPTFFLTEPRTCVRCVWVVCACVIESGIWSPISPRWDWHFDLAYIQRTLICICHAYCCGSVSLAIMLQKISFLFLLCLFVVVVSFLFSFLSFLLLFKRQCFFGGEIKSPKILGKGSLANILQVTHFQPSLGKNKSIRFTCKASKD